MFQQIGEPSSTRTNLNAAVACLLATSVVSTSLSAAWSTRTTSISRALLASSCTVLLTFVVSTLAGRLTSSTWATSLFFSAAAVWFTPVLIAAWEGYVWSIVLASLFAVSLARNLAHCAEPNENDSDDPWRVRPSNHAAAIGVLLSALAVIAGSAIIASLAAALACFLVAWVARSSPQPTRALGLVATFRISVAIAACALIWTPHRGAGGTNAKVENPGSSAPAEDTHSGVILLSEFRPRASIRAPRPRTQPNTSPFRTTQTDIIPFSGEYWFYHHPLSRPPRNSLIQRGSPLTYVFTNVDRHALSMVASQQLQRELDIACCSRIDVSVRNADAEPYNVTLEMILLHTLPAGNPPRRKPQISLGAQPLPGKTLGFPLPATAPISSFDEIRIVFHLTGQRRYRSANVAIEGFALIPR